MAEVAPERRSMPPHALESPAKKQSKWTSEEDRLIIELRRGAMKWDDISRRLPGRSAISCRLHYQNYLERRGEWNEEKKNKLARLYDRLKEEMWFGVASEMEIPWRAAEAMHWQLGEADMARRAGVTPFSLANSTTEGSHGGSRASPRHAHSNSHGGLSRDVGSGRSHSRGGPAGSSRPLASRRESVPSHQHHAPAYPEPVPESYGYSHNVMPLAPIKTETQPQRPGILPGIVDLTTGASPYATMAYTLPHPTVSPAQSTTASPYMTPMMGYSPLEPTGSKRRRSPDADILSPGMRRRH
ncbi:hypothetical protein F4804DRAFT_196565 [Jackrogersella minutella]|nr:hypothetical protein F4804DRAFT_196565 [Jackrogersella minutella]